MKPSRIPCGLCARLGENRYHKISEHYCSLCGQASHEAVGGSCLYCGRKDHCMGTHICERCGVIGHNKSEHTCAYCEQFHTSIYHRCSYCNLPSHELGITPCSYCFSSIHCSGSHPCSKIDCGGVGHDACDHKCTLCDGAHTTEEHRCTLCYQFGHANEEHCGVCGMYYRTREDHCAHLTAIHNMDARLIEDVSKRNAILKTALEQIQSLLGYSSKETMLYEIVKTALESVALQ